MAEREYELLLAGGGRVRWPGSSPEDAARRYVDCNREATVIATRQVRHGLYVGFGRRNVQIIDAASAEGQEAGDAD